METYEKKYKDVQKWIESIYTELSHERQMEAEAFFPELKESDDEKNIKNLIDELKCSLRGANCQNESCNGGQEKRIALLEWAIAWLEKQGEQKPTDKAEPKFKVGDWITRDRNTTMHILNVGDNYYEVEYADGGKAFPNMDYVDKNSHLWTIDDAKEGDVLAIGNEYFLFKEKNKNTSPTVYISHCFCDSAKAFRVTNGRDCGEFFPVENGSSVHPATKEQRDTLFAKIKEAGYEWDAEKRELRKIAQNNNEETNEGNCETDGLYYAKAILEKTFGKVEGYQSDDGILEHKSAINAVKKLSEQK